MSDDLPGHKDAPKTFAERGVTVPFTTPELLWARARQNGDVKELLVPGLAQTRGIFVYEWATIRNRFALSLHDRLLFKEILNGPSPTPDAIATMVLKIAGGGFAGGEAKATTEATAQQADTLALHTRVSLIQRLLERLGATNVGLSVDDMMAEDGALKGTIALAQLAPTFGLTGQALYGRIETLSSLLGTIGLPGLALDAPNRRLVDRLKLLSRALMEWADAGHGDASGEARLIGRVAAESARLAASGLAKIDTETAAIEVLLTEWAERIEMMRAETTRIIWILDGWERFLRLWQNAASQTRMAQSTALVLMSYIIPMIPTKELEAEDRRTWDEINSELAKIIAAHEGGVDMKTMLELLGPEGKEPLAGLTIAAKSPGSRARGLQAEKLTQIVRILEPAMDRPDGAPARKMLDELRPQLVRVRPPRARRAQRMLCEMFEELLVDGEASGKVASRIPRSGVLPVWSLFRERIGDEELSNLGKGLELPENISKLGRAFVAALRPDLDEAAAYTSRARSLIVRLGGESHYHAMQAMVGAVAVGDLLGRLRVELPPRPIPKFEEEDLDKLAAILNEVRKTAPDQVQAALFIVMGRMAEPWNISSVLETLAATGRFRSSAGITGFVATAMLGRLEGQVDDVRKLTEAAPTGTAAATQLGETAMALADSITECARSVAGTNASLSVSGTRGQAEEVEALRERLSDLVGSTMSGGGATALVSAFTGAPATRGENGNIRPGVRWRFDQPLEATALRNAELYAKALRKSAASAPMLGIAPKIAERLEQTVGEFERVAAVLFGQMRTAQLDAAQREAARGHVAGIAFVIEILATTDQAERVLNKGLEAIG